MVKFKHLLLSASSAMAITILTNASAPAAYAADVDPGVCQSLAGTVTAGYIFGETNDQFGGKAGDVDADYGTFFGEGEALYHFCDTNLNVQGDYAFHSHQYDFDEPVDFANDRWHVGGILFWRDQDIGVLGLDVSFLNDDFFGKNSETWRVGLRGEFFVVDMFTVGAGAGFLNGEFFGKSTDGYDVNAWARIYPTENIGLLARVDYSELDWEDAFSPDFDQWAIGAEGEYLLPSVPVSVFAGARYSEAEANGGDFSADGTQVYAGLSVYFGSDGNGGTLASHHRNNTLDNTSVLFERIANPVLD